MKKRWFVGFTVFLATAGVILPPLAADIDFFFSRQFEKLTWKPLAGWTAILGGGKPLQFYLLLCAIVALLLLWVLLTSSYLNYRSGMLQITPDIETPCAAGQGQFGTAKWLRPQKIERFFGVWKVPEKDPAFQALLDAGKADKEEIKHADIPID